MVKANAKTHVMVLLHKQTKKSHIGRGGGTGRTFCGLDVNAAYDGKEEKYTEYISRKHNCKRCLQFYDFYNR